MGVSMDNIHQMVDVNTIIGDPIIKGDVTIIPISKVSFGFASGGSDLPTQAAEKFAGGAGAGVTVKPVAFIVIKPDGDVKLMELGGKSSPVDGVMEALPGLIEKIKGAVSDKKAAKSTDAKVEKAEAKLEKAEAKLEKAEAKAEKTGIRDEARIAKATAKVEAARAEAQAQLEAEKNKKESGD